MPYRIMGDKKITAGTDAVDVDVAYRAFIIQNLSSANTVYFREKNDDGAAVTASTGFALTPGATLDTALAAKTLSIIASAESTDVRLLFLDIG